MNQNQNQNQLFSPANMLQAFYSGCPYRLNHQGEALISFASVNEATTPTEIIYDVDSCINLREEHGRAIIHILATILGTLLGGISEGFIIHINSEHQFTIFPMVNKEFINHFVQQSTLN